ncbi:MAG TPA: chromosome segregation protein SMC [Euzebya sp.]|nr:chromosome segregation protein SMC [Euzebya sp.]
MYLKSLHLRGFKSFADGTRLDFEPGITVIVGPNGSGKSNIVDALTWSMGTRSAKDLRGGQMADVIFAGARGRRAMGRAAVEITIDNADLALPIEFSEVTVGRAMFATGENAYSINDVECRQLDVAELLSDTGLGRETHTIVGQGRIDAVLNARPEERRAFIEEAAGILKHRRRKERALRKLTQMDAHLERLVDVLSEMRRQLRPLERQAEAAQKHRDLSADLHTVRSDRALRELARLLQRWNAEQATRSDSDQRLALLEEALTGQKRAEHDIAHGLGELTPAVRAATEMQFALANIVERASGIVERIVERRNGLAEAAEEPIAGRPPAELRAEAASGEQELGDLMTQVAATAEALEQARATTRQAEQARRAHEQAAAAEARRRAEARERQIRWEGEIAGLRSSLAQAAAEQGRLDTQLQAQNDRAAELEADVAAVNVEIGRLDATGPELFATVRDLEARRARAQAAATEAVKVERELDRTRASLEARADALFAASAEPGEGAQALTAAAEDGAVNGVLGPLASLLHVHDGYAQAVSAALGPLADALVVDSRSAAESSLGFIRDADAGRVLLLVASAPTVVPTGQPALDTIGAVSIGRVIDGIDGVRAAVQRALAGVYVCEDLGAALRLADTRPELVFVTRDGQMAGARGHAGGGAAGHTAVLSRAAAEEARAQAEAVLADLRIAHRKVGDADRDLTAAREELEAAQAVVQESDALITSAAERMGRLRKELGRCQAERAQVQRQFDQLAAQIAQRREKLEALEARGAEPHDPDPRFAEDGVDGDVVAERLEDELAEAREVEVQARLAASTAEQDAAELRRRIAALQTEATRVEAQLAERERRQNARLAAMARCDQLEAVARTILSSAQSSRVAAAGERDLLEEARAEQQRRLGVARSKLAELDEQLTTLRDSRHREDLVRQELGLQMDGVRGRLAELSVSDPEAVIAERGEALLEDGEERDAELAEAEDSLSRRIGLLGTVNPLALEEFQALQERHQFMSDQLDDLRASKKDLMRVIEAVDGRIREVFAAAFSDVAANFEMIFPKLFPGGDGRLVLTDPDDMLLTGVEVEARPPGKKVKRLSLLSGGERSLTALAVLFAIFAARPSPFYVLDEVEAALDDANLGRFLSVVDEFRGTSQWIIVTHQRRTMEVADMIYGVSMAADGVSKVISRRLTDSGLVREAG